MTEAPLTLEELLLAVEILRRTNADLTEENRILRAKLLALTSLGYARHCPEPAEAKPIKRQDDVP